VLQALHRQGHPFQCQRPSFIATQLFASLILLFTACAPSSLPWVPFARGLPTPATIVTFAVDPQDARRVFAGAYDTTGVYISTDAAHTWDVFTDGIESNPVLTFDFVGDSLLAGTTAGLYRLRNARWEQIVAIPAVAVYAITRDTGGAVYLSTNERGIFKSMDAGETWTRVPGLDNEMILSVAAPDTRTLIAGTSGHGVFITRDGGVTWRALDSFTKDYVALLVVDPRDHETIYLSTRSGLFRSRDAGVTWQHVCGGIENEVVHALLFTSNRIYAATDGHGVFASDDVGTSWQNINTGLPSGVAMLALAQLDAQTILVGAQNGIYLTRDAGKTWQSANDGLGVPQIHALALNAQTGTLFVATEDGLFGTDANGDFQRLGNDALRVPILSVAIAPNDPRIVYAGTYRHGIFVSHDGGANWDSVGDIFQGRLSVPGLLVAPSDAATIFACVLFERIYKSTDGGATWHAVWTGMRDGDQVQTMIATPSDPTQMAAGTSEGLYFSSNVGEAWQNIGLNDLTVFALWIDPHDARRVLVGATDGLYQRNEADAVWTRSGLDGITVTKIGRGANGDFFIGTKYNGVWVSHDDAKTWTRLGLDSDSIVALVIDDVRRLLYAATPRGLFKINYP
jgi:photosystem II stability/assembly factor-like uncharacterized protein